MTYLLKNVAFNTRLWLWLWLCQTETLPALIFTPWVQRGAGPGVPLLPCRYRGNDTKISANHYFCFYLSRIFFLVDLRAGCVVHNICKHIIRKLSLSAHPKSRTSAFFETSKRTCSLYVIFHFHVKGRGKSVQHTRQDSRVNTIAFI